VPDRKALLKRWKPAPFPRPVQLRGRSVTLEPLNAARHTADLWAAIKDHPGLWRWFGDGPYRSMASLRRAIAVKVADPAFVFFAVVPRPTGKIAGYASLMRIDPPNGVAEVGNVLYSPALQHTRAATEAMYLMARYVFDDLGYRRYEWKCHAENEPSRRAAARLGFTFEGIFRQHMVVKGKNRDTAWFSMLDGEWPACKRAFEAWLASRNFDDQGSQRQPLQAFRKKRR
jgi:RimJ/RimL family protein N-acetyltransferase